MFAATSLYNFYAKSMLQSDVESFIDATLVVAVHLQKLFSVYL